MNKQKHFSNGFLDGNRKERKNDINDETTKNYRNLIKRPQNAFQNDLQNFRTLLRPFQNTNEKKFWPKHFNELTVFFENSFGSFRNRERMIIYEEFTSLLEKIFNNKLYKNTVEELAPCLTVFCDSLHNVQLTFFEWLFKIYFLQSTTDENKLIILQCLRSIVETTSMARVDNYFYIQIQLRMALTIDNVELLLQVSQLMIIIGKRIPDSLHSHLDNLIQILLDWYMDEKQPKINNYLIENIIEQLEISKHLPYSFNLLNKLMDNFEDYYSDLFSINQSDFNNDQSKVNKSINAKLYKMALCIRIFSIFNRKIYLDNDHNQDYNIFINAINNMIKVILSLESKKNLPMFEELLIECNQSIMILMKILSKFYIVNEFDFTNYCQLLLVMINNELYSQKLIITSLNFIQLYIEHLNVNLSLEFVDQLFSVKFQNLKFTLNEPIQKSFINLFYSLLKIKSVNILDRSYKYILKNIKISLDYLQSLQNNKEEMEFILKNIEMIDFDETNINIDSEQKCIISLYIDIVFLTEIANTKHSLIAMHALSPNFMELMLYHLDLSNEWLAEYYSSIHYSFLYIFGSYCNKHNNYIAQSSLFISNSSNNANVNASNSNQHQISPLFDLTIESETTTENPKSNQNNLIRFKSHASNYFVDIIETLKSVLSINKLQIKSILLCLKLIEDIVSTPLTWNRSKIAIIVNLNKFIELINVVSQYSFSNHYDICASSCTIMKHLLHLLDETDLPVYSQVFFNYRKSCEFNIVHTDPKNVKLFLDLMASLPICSKMILPKSMNQYYNIQNEIFLYPEEAHLTIVSLMCKSASENFSQLSFQSIFDFIKNGNNSLNWLFRVFYSTVDYENLKIPSNVRSTIGYLQFFSNFNTTKVFQNNYWPLIFWICYEFVQHCIENRLKTPLGKPQDTFTKIETIIKMFLNDNRRITLDNDNFDIKYYNISIQALLMIFDNFDKLIYNAIHGNSLRLYTASKISKLFFKKNKATCSEWLNRNRRSIMVMAMKLSQPTIVVHHGQELLRTYMNDRSILTLDEIEFILLLMIDALVQLKVPETIMGYYIWAKQYLNVKFAWIKTVADEANCRYEKALIEYRTLLKAKLDSINGDSNQTVLNLVTSNKNFNCNSYTINFFRKRIINCLLNIEQYNSISEWSDGPTLRNDLFNSNIDYSYLQSMSTFNYASMDIAENNPQAEMHFDNESNYHQIQQNLFECGKKFYFAKTEKNVQQLNDLIEKQLNPLITSFYMCGSTVVNHFSILQKIAYQLQFMANNYDLSLNKTNVFGHFNVNLDADLMVNLLLWQRVINQLNEKTNTIEKATMKNILDNLLLKTAGKARKSQNFKLSRDLLFEYYRSTIDSNIIIKNQMDKEMWLEIFQNSFPKFSKNLLNFCLESSKYIFANNDSNLAIEVLFKSIDVILDKPMDQNNSLEITSRIFLKLAQLIQTESYKCTSDELYKLNSHKKFCLIDEKVSCIKNLSPADNISGKLLLFAVNNCPSLGKAWFQLADWSYRFGRKLSDNDEDKINTGNEIVAKEETVIEFYKLAASSYIKFLHITNHTGCDDVDATLRLLRLILKHAPELREILESGLKETPTKPWKNITLQLFSRLNHHELYVRQSISELLCRIGSDSPHLVIFPAVTGLLDDQIKSKEFDYTSTKNDDDDDDDENNQFIEQSLVRNCYASLLDTLSQRDPNLISQTKLLVHELRRITVLWDELWIGILEHSLNEMKKQVLALEKEIEKTTKNVNFYETEKVMFIKEQHSIFFRKILYSLKLTNMLTSDAPETPHEEWFQKNFNQLITVLIDSITNEKNIYEPSNILMHYQNLYQLLRKQSMSTNNYRYQMQDISPKLAQLANTVIPLPGLNGSKVTLKGISKTVSVLHTYTKPKKIIFIGSDGRNYSYLFKGHEDLHLDERIMQFLSIVNKMIVKFGPSQINNKLLLRARHYSVTPLGNKSGLIQWVEGGHALFNLYKRWLSNRETSLDEFKKRITANGIFKMKLAEHGITSENRNDWSLETLKTIYSELVEETPNDLILKEIWCSSINSYDHWNLTQNFINSNAVMSVIGYILGLGDRHLDNILLDLTTGEVIHIDYNICFEKGKTLRVPEMVLCRLTQNIINAFGITGVEGTFRISCENILKTLRKGKETLLTLLEAFVYDPLVDWTPDHEEGFTGAIYGGAKIAQLAREMKIIPKKQMEKENKEAIERLKELMKLVEQRNTDWPKIDNTETQDISILAKSTPKINKTSTSKDIEVHNVPRKNRRNAYAFSVWKRIRMKLEGRDPDVNKRSTVFEQVNYFINESISVDYLCRMFEGWTSWV